MVEFNLSDKRDNFLNMQIDEFIYYEKHVKEFIRLLKEKLQFFYAEEDENKPKEYVDFLNKVLKENIDKLAGDKLNGNN